MIEKSCLIPIFAAAVFFLPLLSLENMSMDVEEARLGALVVLSSRKVQHHRAGDKKPAWHSRHLVLFPQFRFFHFHFQVNFYTNVPIIYNLLTIKSTSTSHVIFQAKVSMPPSNSEYPSKTQRASEPEC